MDCVDWNWIPLPRSCVTRKSLSVGFPMGNRSVLPCLGRRAKGWYGVGTVTLNRIFEAERLRNRIRSSHVRGSLYRVTSLPACPPFYLGKSLFTFTSLSSLSSTRAALSRDSSSGRRPLVRARARAYALERIACSTFTIRARVKADRKEWNLILTPSALTFTTQEKGAGIFDSFSFSPILSRIEGRSDIKPRFLSYLFAPNEFRLLNFRGEVRTPSSDSFY